VKIHRKLLRTFIYIYIMYIYILCIYIYILCIYIYYVYIIYIYIVPYVIKKQHLTETALDPDLPTVYLLVVLSRCFPLLKSDMIQLERMRHSWFRTLLWVNVKEPQKSNLRMSREMSRDWFVIPCDPGNIPFYDVCMAFRASIALHCFTQINRRDQLRMSREPRWFVTDYS
jgi:Ca2+/Na+ antiporter